MNAALATFRSPAYRRVWLAGVLLARATWAERLAVGWLVLTATDSVFLTAVSFAVRLAPSLFAAPFAGAISDRMPRNRLLGFTAAYRAVILALLAAFTLSGLEPLWVVFVLVALSGFGKAFEVPASQALATDTVPRRFAMTAVALLSVGNQGAGALGGLSSGVVIAVFGIPTAMFAGSAVFLIGGLVVGTMRPVVSQRPRSDPRTTSVLRDVLDGLRVMISIPLVRTLLICAVVVEIFGFTYHAVLPTVARDVLEVGEVGLGMLSMMAGFGSLAGVIALTALGDVRRKGLLLLGITVGFGVFMIAFAASGSYPLSLVVIAGIGAMTAAYDAMQWILLQQVVPDDMRGRALGGWVFAISFGWIGHLALGSAAEAIGVPWALAAAGAVLLLTGVVAAVAAPKLRAA
jgi:MFS family permease